MPDLESHIASWRRAMRASGIKNSVLEELESHIREDIAQQMQSGTDAQQAFETAAERMGSPDELQSEFQKVPFKPFKPFIHMTPTARRRATHFLVIVALIAIGVAFLLPPVAKYKAHQAFAVWDIIVCVAGVGATIAGAVFAMRTRRAS